MLFICLSILMCAHAYVCVHDEMEQIGRVEWLFTVQVRCFVRVI